MKLGALVLTLLFATSAYAVPAAQEPLVDLLPARAAAGALVRRHAIQPLMDFIFSDAEMMKEMRPFLERTLGIDITRLDGIAIFVIDPTGTPQVGAVLRMGGASASPLHLKVAGDANGTPLYALDGKGNVCARTRAGLVLGDRGAVLAAVGVDRGKEPALARESTLGKMLSTSYDTVDLVVAVSTLPADKTMGVDDGVLTLKKDGLLELVAHGNPTSLLLLKTIAMQAIAAGLQQAQKEKDDAINAATPDAAKGMGVLLVYYAAKRMAAELTPVVNGNTLSMRYQLPDMRPLASPGVMLISMGVTGAVFAESALKKYSAKSKLASVHAEVKRISSSVVATVAGGKKLASLKSTDWTPQGPCCGQVDNKCSADPKAFSSATWKALGFTPLEPSAFRYRVRVDAKAKRVTIEAEGDPDCDGEVTTVSTVVGFDSGDGVIGELVDSGDMQ